MTITNIAVCGIGGQGVMTATEILAEAALSLGFDVKKTEVAGMSQRGGVVTSHLRFGPQVLSPQIMPGEADLLVGFEAAEALRWAHMLKPGGVALVNQGRFVPPVVTIGLYDYPEDPIAEMRRLGLAVFDFDASALAMQLGNIRLGNTVMLGAMSDRLPFPADVLRKAVLDRFGTRKPELLELNREAFELGRAAVAQPAPAQAIACRLPPHAFGGRWPRAREISSAVSRTSGAQSGLKRSDGVDSDRPAISSPPSSRIPAAMQRTPDSTSSRSKATPWRRTRSSSFSSAGSAVIEAGVEAGRPVRRA